MEFSLNSSNNVREPILRASVLYKDPIVAEIGVLKGDHAAFIYQKLNPGTLFLIDNWKGNKKDYLFVKERFHGKRVILLRKDSEQASKDFKNNYFDLVYIDANHTFLEVMKDLIFWYPKVKPGGMIAGHDLNKEQYNESGIRCGVKKAVDIFTEEMGLKYYISKNKRDFWFFKNNS